MTSPGGSPKDAEMGDAAAGSPSAAGAGSTSEGAATGEKRKRAVEPDGGPDVGQRGEEVRAPPMVAASSTGGNKAAKVDEA